MTTVPQSGLRLRNGEHGYGLVTKALHWLTVLALLAQFALGYLMSSDLVEDLIGEEGGGRGRGRSGEDGGQGRGRGGDELDGEALLPFHIAVGVSILVLALIRLVWRRTTPLPPWAETLPVRERRLATVVERVLYTLLFVMPLTGLGLVLLSGEDWDLADGREVSAPLELLGDDLLLGLHVASHVAFFLTLAVHLTLVTKNRLVGRML